MGNRKQPRGLSLLLCAALLVGQLGTTVYAEGPPTGGGGLCEHHPAHTTECGYVEAVEGQPCQHKHTDDCYTDELICGYDEDAEPATSSDAAHEHTQECYALDCPHERGEHDGDCGYIEAVPGHTCGFVCEICDEEKDSGGVWEQTGQKEESGLSAITVTGFDKLDAAVQYQTVSPGTKLDKLNLPATLGASGYTVGEDTEPAPIIIGGVTWKPDTKYDDTAEQGGYTFTPVLPAGYTCAGDMALPEIYVRIGAANVTLANDSNDYNTGDMAAFQAILVAHPSLVSGDVKKEDPASWTGLVIWDENSTPKRITRLELSSKGLSGKLDVSGLTALAYLDCSLNQLTELNVTGTALASLYCFKNQLKTLPKLDGLTKLVTLNCAKNQLTTLDVTGLKVLTYLNCSENQLTELNVTETGLTYLDCSKNQLKTLPKLDGLTKLVTLNCAKNQLTALNVAGTALTHLNCQGNNLETLDGLGSLTKLVTLNCSENQLTALNVGNLTGLTYLDCFDNQLTALDVSKNTSLTYLYCYDNPFASFKTKAGYTLTVNQTAGGTVWTTAFDSSNNAITLMAKPGTGYSFQSWTTPPAGASQSGYEISFDLTSDTTIQAAFVNNNDVNNDGYHDGDVAAINAIIKNNGLSSISKDDPANWTGKGIVWDTSSPKRIIKLTINSKGLSGKLDVSALTGLTSLNCANNNLTGTLDVGNLTLLTFLSCSGNQLTGTLDVGNLTLLTHLDCFDNQLTGTLDVGNLTGLTSLSCFDNQLTGTLDVGNLTLLTYLDCSGNQLTGTLDVGNLTRLISLYCFDNQLMALDLSGLTSLTYLYCGNTPLSSFTAPDGKTLTIQPASGGKVIFGSNDPNVYPNPGYDLATKQTTLTAVPDSGKQLDGWTRDGAGAGSANPLVFALSGDGTVTAAFKDSGSAPSGGGDHSNSDDSRSSVTITTPQPPQPDSPVLAVVETPVTVKDGTATGTANDGSTSEAITKALNAAKQKGREKYGIAVQYDATTAVAYDGFSITVRRATLDRLLGPNNGVKYLTLHTSIVDMTFGPAELTEIARQTSGDVTFTAAKAPGLTGDALSAIGTRPAYDLKISYQKDGKPVYLSSVGSVSVGLVYTPAETEQAGGLYLVYADGKGGAQWLYRSSYDGSGSVIGSVEHFSVYGVGYKPAPVFTDTVNHWAKSDIDFVASRGLLTGTSDATFSPNSTITRGMFVTALGRLAGIDPAAYASSSRFSDVPATAYYAPFVEWAASKGIVNGTGANTFEPDRPVTREEMAAIMQRYAEKLGYVLPKEREAEIFVDDNQITGSMKDAVQAMQQAGVMNGRGGHLFAPKDTATRAEAAAVLRRFVEVVIDRDTAEGWTQNEAGGRSYYENHKPVTGWKQIDGKWYYFDAAGLMQADGWRQIGGSWYYFYPDGGMAANTTIGGYEVGPDGKRKE
ncbi:leucine-rich repeat domain-containing protein [Lachnoclostridium pacaense]|uniref:leucine-rich repeat domain-containing protein n=1 Tax=Enterocloster hominis (ex Hitch et al. 2024) TaxID=1917870 RepID=UPI001D11E74D|nr:leucine-rich repeat domain-containing protein [Lachnoclostridium pacaense]MCC2878406.1 leucine-rich repeat domain-containing protein [Lachnoclostridium pacaense]